MVHRRGDARRVHQRHDGRVVLAEPDERRLVAENAIDAVAGRVPVVIGCTSYTAREAGELGASRNRCGRRRDRVDPAAVLEDVPRRDRGVLPRPLRRGGRAGDDLQLAARLQRRHRRRPRRPPRGDRQRRRDQGLHAGLRSSSRRRRAGSSTGPACSARSCPRRGSTSCSSVGGDGFIGGGSLWGARDAEFWEAVWRGRHRRGPRARAPHGRPLPEAVAARRLGRPLRRLPEPAEGAHAAARPADRPRCGRHGCRSPTRRASPRCAQVLVEAGLSAQPAEVA